MRDFGRKKKDIKLERCINNVALKTLFNILYGFYLKESLISNYTSGLDVNIIYRLTLIYYFFINA